MNLAGTGAHLITGSDWAWLAQSEDKQQSSGFASPFVNI